jgi:hypothetical protein
MNIKSIAAAAACHLVLAATVFGGTASAGPILSFSTGGAPVYHVRPATVDSGGTVVISAAFGFCNRMKTVSAATRGTRGRLHFSGPLQ